MEGEPAGLWGGRHHQSAFALLRHRYNCERFKGEFAVIKVFALIGLFLKTLLKAGLMSVTSPALCRWHSPSPVGGHHWHHQAFVCKGLRQFHDQCFGTVHSVAATLPMLPGAEEARNNIV